MFYALLINLTSYDDPVIDKMLWWSDPESEP